MRFFLANAERRAHHFQELLELAEEQVIFVAVVKIKGGTTDRGAVQHFLHRHVIDRLLLDQRHQSTAEPLTRTPYALIHLATIRLAPLLFWLFPLPSIFLQFGALVRGPPILGHLIFGHRPPLCSATRDRPRLSGVSPLHCE